MRGRSDESRREVKMTQPSTAVAVLHATIDLGELF